MYCVLLHKIPTFHIYILLHFKHKYTMKTVTLFYKKALQIAAIILLSFLVPYILLWCIQTIVTFQFNILTDGILAFYLTIAVVLSLILTVAFIDVEVETIEHKWYTKS